jgi:uncharacterized protein (TIGR00661 family)
MRIAYGVHGYGRGHSSRALAILPELTARHEVLLLAGGDADTALAGSYAVQRIPTLKYVVRRDGRRSTWRTLARAVPSLLDLRFRGPASEMVEEALRDFEPDVVISDSEPWSHRAARRMGLPRISFDHYAVLVYCEWPMSGWNKLACRLESLAYRRLMSGAADRYVIVSFYSPPPRRQGVCVVGPVLRETVLEAVPERGAYLLTYFSKGRHHFTPQVEDALRGLDIPVIVYGTGREGTDGGLDFRPPSNTRFVEDLARSRAVFATAGNQLISEAIHLRKPLLLMPEDCLEQRLNARASERMGIGEYTSRRAVSAEKVRSFLGRVPEYAQNFREQPADGRRQAVQAIERYAEELTGA